MKKQILILGFSFLSMSLFAHGESPEMFTIMGYVFIIPIIIGLLEYYLIKKRFEIKRNVKLKLVFLNLGITIIGYIIVFYIIDSFKIRNENTLLLLIMISLTILQVILKVITYNRLIVNNKDHYRKMIKLVFYETITINSLFYAILMIMIN